MLTEGELERFWPKVDRRGVWECWPWMASRRHDGYGRMRREGHGPMEHAHRLMWQATHGEIPAGLSVCHSCGNRACVNPLHLYLATNAEHNVDRGMDGRLPRGEAQWAAKLTREQVLQIRRLVAAGESYRGLARRFGVSGTSVSDIVHRINWAWLEEED